MDTTICCSVEGCNRPVSYNKAHGLCRNHWQNAYRHGLLPGRKCSVDDCERNAVARGYCTKHYEQWSIHGDPLIRGKKANGEGCTANGYLLYTNPAPDGPHYIREHVRIMEEHLGRELDTDELVHHLNGDKLDNRIENLQIISRSEHCTLHHSGENNVNAKLNADKVREIRHRYAAGGVSQRQLASEFGVKQSAIWNIIQRSTWQHVE
jgi:hypothetical protein